MKKSLLLIAFLFSLFASSQIIYVDASANGSNNGTSWSNAFTTLNGAFQIAGNGDEIWMAAGTYVPGTSPSNRFQTGNNISIYGGFNGTETLRSQRDISNNVTILSGDVNGNDSFPIQYNDASRSDNIQNIMLITSQQFLLDGVTISGGVSDGPTSDSQEGAAILYRSSSSNITLRNLIIEDNVITRGGAIKINAEGSNGNVLVDKVIFRNNLAKFATAFYISAGNSSNYSVTMSNCLIHDNENRNVNAANLANAGVIWSRSNSLGSTLSTTITNCTIVNNDFQGTQGATTGAVIVGSRESGTGDMEINNSIIYNNNFRSQGEPTTYGNYQQTSIPVVVNNCISPDNFSNIPNAASNVNNSTTSDPLFTDIANGDFTLQQNSPGIDTGDSSLTVGLTDLQGNDRISGADVDMGCFETISALNRVYVDTSAVGNNDGSSWSDAYTSLETALLTGGNEVWVAAGTYVASGTIADSFEIINNTKIYGGFSGNETNISQRDPITNPVILSGDVNGNDVIRASNDFVDSSRTDNKTRVISIQGSGILLDGLTISGGYAADPNANDEDHEGAGILLRNVAGTLDIVNCIIENNISLIAGTITLEKADGGNNRLNIDRSTFRNNLGLFATVLYVKTNSMNADSPSSSVNTQITNSLFSRNETKNSAQFTGNSGVIWFANNSGTNNTATVANCTFTENVFLGTGASGTGPVIAASRTDSNAFTELYVYNSIFWNNVLTNVNNMTAIGNYGQTSAQVYRIRNSLSSPGFSNIGDKSGIQTGNPVFSNPSSDDFSLTSGSVAINNGDDSLIPTGANADILFNQRIAGSAVDIGAYEFGATAGLEENSKLEFRLYPNPASDIITVAVDNNAFAKATIYNLQGKLIATSKEPTIQVADLKAGMYLIKVTTEEGATATQQFIKK